MSLGSGIAVSLTHQKQSLTVHVQGVYSLTTAHKLLNNSLVQEKYFKIKMGLGFCCLQEA